MLSHRLLAASLLVPCFVSCSTVGPQPAEPLAPPQAQAPGPRPRPVIPLNSRPYFNAEVALGSGDDAHNIDGGPDDETDAFFFRFRAEGTSPSGFGGGFAVESMTSDDDLFGATGDQRVSYIEWDPYFLYRLVAGSRFRMPVRVGPWVQVYGLDDQSSDNRIIWATVGIRGEVEPEVALARGRDFEFSLFADLSLAGGQTEVDAEVGPLDNRFESEANAFGFEIGPRIRFSRFMTSLAFVHRQTNMDESDPENGIVVLGFDNEFNGIVFTFGGGF